MSEEEVQLSCVENKSTVLIERECDIKLTEFSFSKDF